MRGKDRLCVLSPFDHARIVSNPLIKAVIPSPSAVIDPLFFQIKPVTAEEVNQFRRSTVLSLDDLDKVLVPRVVIVDPRSNDRFFRILNLSFQKVSLPPPLNSTIRISDVATRSSCSRKWRGVWRSINMIHVKFRHVCPCSEGNVNLVKSSCRCSIHSSGEHLIRSRIELSLYNDRLYRVTIK